MTPAQAAELAAELSTEADNVRRTAAGVVAALRTTDHHQLAGQAMDAAHIAALCLRNLHALALRAAP